MYICNKYEIQIIKINFEIHEIKIVYPFIE